MHIKPSTFTLNLYFQVFRTTTNISVQISDRHKWRSTGSSGREHVEEARYRRGMLAHLDQLHLRVPDLRNAHIRQLGADICGQE